MISIKKFLDTEAIEPPVGELEGDELSVAGVECYRAALAAVSKNAVKICPSLGVELESNLQALERRLAVKITPESLRRTEKQVEAQLDEWGIQTSKHFNKQADEVKELLLALAKTAESVGSRDQSYSKKFKDLTGRLEKIADLNDLTQMRLSLVERVTELKISVDQMTRENQQLVAQLKTEVSTYETKLKVVEELASKDPLTNLANRRSVEQRIKSNIEAGREFCIVVIDLNGFKQVNDKYGHPAGDELLAQFAAELQLSARPGDLVGRWGGDEFIMVMSCNLQTAEAHIERTRQWILGKYTIGPADGPRNVIQISASIGAAEWHPGETMQRLIARADDAMYKDKKL